jgi:hypothetical protein
MANVGSHQLIGIEISSLLDLAELSTDGYSYVRLESFAGRFLVGDVISYQGKAGVVHA